MSDQTAGPGGPLPTATPTPEQQPARQPAAGSGLPPTPDRLADGVERPVDRRWLTVSRIGGAIGVAALALITGIAGVIVLSAKDFSLLPLVGGLWLLLVVVLFLLAMLWPGLRYRHLRYSLDGQALRIRRGVFWRSEIAVPRSRVQHTDVNRGPVERAFELATLVVFTAGTEHSSVSLPGLAYERAQGLRDRLIEGGEDDAV